MKNIYLIIVLFLSACVAPPDYTDGLLENIPAIINKGDFFSISVLGDEYSEEKEWNLVFDVAMEDTLMTILVIHNLDISPTDSSSLYIMNNNGDTVFSSLLLNNVVEINEIPVNSIGEPKQLSFNADNFTGNLEFQLVKK